MSNFPNIDGFESMVIFIAEVHLNCHVQPRSLQNQLTQSSSALESSEELLAFANNAMLIRDGEDFMKVGASSAFFCQNEK